MIKRKTPPPMPFFRVTEAGDQRATKEKNAETENKRSVSEARENTCLTVDEQSTTPARTRKSFADTIKNARQTAQNVEENKHDR